MRFSILVGVYTCALSRFLEVQSASQAIRFGLVWMALTTVFEFCFGHYVVGDSCADLLRDYNVLNCRMWGMFIIWVGSLS